MMLRWLRMGDLHDRIERAGGLLTKAGLAKRWGVSQQYLGNATRRADFPRAIKIADGTREREVWLAVEADAWHNTPRRPTE